LKYHDGRSPIRLGVSACLLGQEVRFDGGHKRDGFLSDVLGRFVEWVPVCPELEAGLGVPRPALRLMRAGSELRVVETGSGRDHTPALARTAAQRVAALRRLELCGYVLKKSSPSCGMERVKVYAQGAPARREGRGLFAAALLEALPRLPVEAEGRLHDPVLRENFIERIFAYRRLLDLFGARWTARDVVAFHTAHKLQLLAHAPEAYRALGRLVARVNALPRAELRARYEEGFMQALARRATRGRHANVLQHMAGFLREGLGREERAELGEAIQDHRRGLVPLVVPLVLVRHHARRLGVGYLLGQVYLEPHPKELMLRNHV
jgi:uncharacterized protein YbgA (DUF1722 family)/uncharacterized protein YbbK (DUF523 family)